jgi:uncharacterized protein YutE (UPF0331/DUF86 family)
VNRDLIESRFVDIRGSVDRLEETRDLSRSEFLADQDTIDIACYRLLIAIEAAIQICFHISAQRLHKTPDSYGECFALLGEAGIVDSPLAERLQLMARFRNMLVHVYWEVDYDRVYEILREHLTDLHAFVQAIGETL